MKAARSSRVFFSLAVSLFYCAAGAEADWRSEMFPPDWRPVDEQPIDGVNIFFDAEGTRDLYGSVVSPGHPDYHPFRYLHDFSYAGYHRGETPIPPEDPSWRGPDRIFDVTLEPYGCIPDGDMQHNCVPGIQKAIEDAGSAGGGVVYLPAGEYRLISSSSTEFLRITESGVILRGDGPARTFLKVDPFMGGTVSMYRKIVINIVGGNTWTADAHASTARSAITAALLLPTKVIPVASVASFTPGDSVVISGQRTAAFLAEHDMAGTWYTGRPGYLFRRTVTAIDAAAKTITVDVPTRYRIRLSDRPEVVKVPRGVSEVGLEGFSIGMIRHPDPWFYEGDINAARDNLDPPIIHDLWQTRAITMQNVCDSWIHGLASYRPIENAGRYCENLITGKRYGDYEIEILNEVLLIEQSRNITVKEVRFKNAQVDAGSSNGYAIRLSGSEVLLDHVVIEKFKKGFAIMNSWASGNVVKDSTTKDPLDAADLFHWELSMSNLIDNHTFDGGWWSAVIEGMGSTGQGHSTTESVFWNIQGLRKPDTGIRSTFDRDNDENGIPDIKEPHGDLPDAALVISCQYGWGYVIGSRGLFSDVLAPRMQRAIGDDWSRPHMFPPDWREGIGYDRPGLSFGSLEPRSLYDAQLAIRLGRPTDNNRPPLAVIDDVFPNIVFPDDVVSFIGHGSDSDGEVAGYRWRSSVDGELSDEASFSRSAAAFSPGVHTIFFKVEDDQGTSSREVETTIDVRPAPPISGGPLILDDGQSGTSSKGKWSPSGGVSPYGSSSLYSRSFGATYTFDVSVPRRGAFDVYLWWSTYPSRSPDVPVQVRHAAGTDTVEVDQLSNGGEWVLIGTWVFDSNASVTIISRGDGSTCADAVKLMPAGG